jgi:hypothetical protein
LSDEPKLPTVDEQTGGKVGAGLPKGDEAMRLLRRAVCELVRGAMVSEAMTNGDKIRFANAITASSMFRSPARAAGLLIELGEREGPLASSEAWRYHRAADAFSDYAKAEDAKILTADWPEQNEVLGNETISPKDVAA